MTIRSFTFLAKSRIVFSGSGYTIPSFRIEAVRKDLAGVLVGYAGSYDPKVGVGPFDPVFGKIFGKGPERFHSFFDNHVSLSGVIGQHHETLRVLFYSDIRAVFLTLSL